MKIDAEIKKTLLEALRSGNYREGKGCLYNNITQCHCTLGVFADALGMKIAPDGLELLDEFGGKDAYAPLENILGVDVVHDVWCKNDNDIDYIGFKGMAAWFEKKF